MDWWDKKMCLHTKFISGLFNEPSINLWKTHLGYQLNIFNPWFKISRYLRDYHDPSDFIEHDGVIYFAAKNTDDRYALFKIDNSTAFQLGDIDHQYIRTKQPFGAPNIQKNILVANDKLCYLTPDGIYYLDLANPSQTHLVSGSDNYNYHIAGGDYTNYQFGDFVFYQEGITSNSQLLKIDFSLSLPSLERIELNPLKSSLPRHFVEFEGYLFFTAIEGLFDQLVWYYNPVTGLYKYDVINNKSSGSMGFADDDPFYLFDNRLFFYKHEIVINTNGTPEVIDNALCVDGQSLTRKMVEVNGEYYYIGFTDDSSATFRYDLYSCISGVVNKETCLLNEHNGISDFIAYDDKIYIGSSVEPDFQYELYKWPEDPDNGLCQGTTGVGVNKYSETKILIYPNPTLEIVHINVSRSVINEISLYNAVGEKIYSLNNYKIRNGSDAEIDVSNFPQGLYHLIITLDNYYSATYKLLVN